MSATIQSTKFLYSSTRELIESFDLAVELQTFDEDMYWQIVNRLRRIGRYVGQAIPIRGSSVSHRYLITVEIPRKGRARFLRRHRKELMEMGFGGPNLS